MSTFFVVGLVIGLNIGLLAAAIALRYLGAREAIAFYKLGVRHEREGFPIIEPDSEAVHR